MKKISSNSDINELNEQGGITCAVICGVACHVIPPFLASVSTAISAY